MSRLMALAQQDTSPPPTAAIVAVAGLFLLLTIAALVDLSKRPTRLLWGEKKWIWTLVIVIPFGLGWAVYILFGRLTEQDLIEIEEERSSGQ